MKHNLVKQFIEDVDWGNLDYLVIDFPPGTGDEAISISQLLKDISGAVIVSTPQQVALLDVAKSIDFSRKVNIPVIGLVENMAGEVFGRDKVKSFADEQRVNFLGSLELDKEIAESGDNGKPFVKNNSRNSESFQRITDNIILFCENK